MQWNNGYIPPSGMTAKFRQGQLGYGQQPPLHGSRAFLQANKAQYPGGMTAGFPAGPTMVGPSQTPQPMGTFLSLQRTRVIRGPLNRRLGCRCPSPSPNPVAENRRMMATWGCAGIMHRYQYNGLQRTRNRVFEAAICEKHCLHELLTVNPAFLAVLQTEIDQTQ
jgi:hypothetical protein